MNTTSKGNKFEDKAVEFLISNSFTIIDRNYHAKKLGEIDIICKKDDTYHFVEVKSGDSFEAVYNITPAKLHKLYRSIEYYLKIKNLDVSYCVDAIIFAGDELEYLENITL
ncbi:MAG: YraN family protein [Campylobacterota bacterium]|nr:YraN family protein [Campylobacterota bacterium]